MADRMGPQHPPTARKRATRLYYFTLPVNRCYIQLTPAQAVHSGTDLQSAAAAVLGYRQAPVKGRGIEVPPVREVATERLRALLRSALSGQVRLTSTGLCLSSAPLLLVGAGRCLTRSVHGVAQQGALPAQAGTLSP